MYRYRDMASGATKRSTNRFHHLDKIGTPLMVKAYRFNSARGNEGNQSIKREAILVKGSNGSARFEGLCWGYYGEGPRGLKQLLLKLGIPQKRAELLANESDRGDDVGTDWEYALPITQKEKDFDTADAYGFKPVMSCGTWLGTFGFNEWRIWKIGGVSVCGWQCARLVDGYYCDHQTTPGSGVAVSKTMEEACEHVLSVIAANEAANRRQALLARLPSSSP